MMGIYAYIPKLVTVPLKQKLSLGSFGLKSTAETKILFWAQVALRTF